MDSARKVLIVDDEPNIVLSLDFLMRKNGYTVFIARNGEEAIDLAQKELPDLLLLDIMMPKVSGYEVCDFVKSHPDLADCKIIFLSAKGKEADIEKGLKMGADLYVVKPFSTRDLIKKISALYAS